MISEPAKVDEKEESQTRSLIEQFANYAESGPTFDPQGRYLCGACSFRQGDASCGIVSGRISFRTGGCRLWTRQTLPRDSWPHKLTQSEADYAERPEAKGFGCSPRCEYGKPARQTAGMGRGIWCEFWGLHVKAFACCAEEDGPDLKLAPNESKSEED